MTERYHDDGGIRFWHVHAFKSTREILEHVAAGGVQVIAAQTPAPTDSSRAGAASVGRGLHGSRAAS